MAAKSQPIACFFLQPARHRITLSGVPTCVFFPLLSKFNVWGLAQQEGAPRPRLPRRQAQPSRRRFFLTAQVSTRRLVMRGRQGYFCHKHTESHRPHATPGPTRARDRVTGGFSEAVPERKPAANLSERESAPARIPRPRWLRGFRFLCKEPSVYDAKCV